MGWIGIYLPGSSKTASRIGIFSIVMGADYSFEVKNAEAWVGLNNSVNTFFKVELKYGF